MIKYLLIFWLMAWIVGCSDNKRPIPKPPTYLKVALPDREYVNFEDTCGFSFDVPSFFSVENAANGACNRDIHFGELNGTLHLSFIKMDTTLGAYVDYALSKVDEHKVKATAIFDSIVTTNNGQSGGVLFALQGNVASPFQFFLTDSTAYFVSGVVYFNARPNYDSIKPVLNYIESDLFRLMETIKW